MRKQLLALSLILVMFLGIAAQASGPGGSFIHSKSWSLADRFVKFMGTSGNTCKDFKRFSEKVKAGDFIAYEPCWLCYCNR